LTTRSLFFQGILLTALILALAPSHQVFAAKTILMQATLNPTQEDQGVSVAITGRVFDAAGASIPNAIISVQVNNPESTTIHLAVAYSGQDGSFQDSFIISSNFMGGNYTTYLVADKPGYESARITLTFAYSSPDFSLESSTPSLSIRQGDSSIVTITIIPLRGFNQGVNLTALKLPSGVSAQFSPSSVLPKATVTVTLTISETASLGNYIVILIGVSRSTTHSVPLQLTITRGPLQTYYLLAGLSIIVIFVVGLSIRRRNRRARKLAAAEAILKQGSADKGYVTTAGAIARLEELRANNQVDDTTYTKLRKEYERRLEKSK